MRIEEILTKEEIVTLYKILGKLDKHPEKDVNEKDQYLLMQILALVEERIATIGTSFSEMREINEKSQNLGALGRENDWLDVTAKGHFVQACLREEPHWAL